MSEQTWTIQKPKGYKSHKVVYDPHPILIVNVDYTIFQLQQALGESYQEFEVTDDGGFLTIKEV